MEITIQEHWYAPFVSRSFKKLIKVLSIILLVIGVISGAIFAYLVYDSGKGILLSLCCFVGVTLAVPLVFLLFEVFLLFLFRIVSIIKRASSNVYLVLSDDGKNVRIKRNDKVLVSFTSDSFVDFSAGQNAILICFVDGDIIKKYPFSLSFVLDKDKDEVYDFFISLKAQGVPVSQEVVERTEKKGSFSNLIIMWGIAAVGVGLPLLVGGELTGRLARLFGLGILCGVIALVMTISRLIKKR